MNEADGEADLDIIIDGAVSLNIGGRAECGIVTQVATGEYPFYGGAVTVTPSAEAVTLATKDTVVRSDIVVEAIPSNYGLITWNGSTLTVS